MSVMMINIYQRYNMIYIRIGTHVVTLYICNHMRVDTTLV